MPEKITVTINSATGATQDIVGELVGGVFVPGTVLYQGDGIDQLSLVDAGHPLFVQGQMNVAGTVQTSGTITDNTPGLQTVPQKNSYDVTNTSQTIAALDANRRWLEVYNDGSYKVWLNPGSASGATSGVGIPLYPGRMWEAPAEFAMSAIIDSTAGSSSTKLHIMGYA